MIEELHIQNFRCFEDITISSIGQVNLIVGKNNIGKTSLLEALYVYAKNGNVWAIHQILNQRQDSFYPSQNNQFNQKSMEARVIFDSISNIFHKKTKANEFTCRLKNNDTEITIQKSDSVYHLAKEKNSHLDYNSTDSYRGDGFLITKSIKTEKDITLSIATIPSTIIDDINKINKGMRSPEVPLAHCKSSNYDVTLLSDTWSELNDSNGVDSINDVMKIVDSRISQVYYTPKREAKVRLNEYKEAQMLSSLGEGATRIFQLFILAYSAEGGILTIDEFENGLHYSIQEDIFRELFKITKELGIQVFITTHSAETIKAFSKVANEDDGICARLIGLERSEKKSTKGKIFSITYEADEMQSFIELGMEMRG